MGEKELIWLDKKFVEDFKKLDSTEEQDKAVRNLLAKKSIDISSDLEMLDDNMLRFRSSCLSHKNELKKVYSEQSDQLGKLWEDMGDLSSYITRHAREFTHEVSKTTDAIKSLSSDVGNLKKQLNEVNVYGAERIIELSRLISSLDDSTKDILSQILTKKQ